MTAHHRSGDARPGRPVRRTRRSGSAGPPDGVRLAYAIHGSGPPLVVASCWLSHLQYDWQSPVWRHFLDQLGALATVIRYDERGFGMSDWTVDDFSLEARLADLEAVVAAAGLERFALLGMSGGSAVAMAYAIAHPERVSRLILYGTVCGEPVALLARRAGRGGDVPEHDPGRLGEGGSGLPAGLHDEVHPRRDRGADALVRRPPADVDVARQRRGQPDRPPAGGHRGRPARRSRRRRSCSRRSATGRRRSTTPSAVSSLIPDARLVPLQSRNHILLADEPAWRVFIDEVAAFLEPERQATATSRRRPTDRGALAARARGPPTRRRRPDERGDRRGPDPERPNGRAAPVERLREARAERPRRRARPPSRSTCGTSSPERRRRPRLRVGRHRAVDLASPIGCWRGSAARPSRAYGHAQAARGGGTRAEVTHMSATMLAETESTLPGRPVDGAIDADRHGDAGQRARAPVGRSVQLGRRPAGGARWREPRPEPDGVPARRPGRVRRRVPPRHARAAVRRRDRRRHGGRALLGRRARACSGSTAPPPTWRTSRSRSGSRPPSPDDRVEAMLAAWRERCPIYLALLKPQSIALTAERKGAPPRVASSRRPRRRAVRAGWASRRARDDAGRTGSPRAASGARRR